ncbi:MAG TPA: hypothetical protein PLA68_17175 [Panacibacter sp.]|nr:hypothetical protein [Panacibacter sp.]
MPNSQTELLCEFINKRELITGNLIIFNAVVLFYKETQLKKITSEVQIITLPKEMVLYIIEFLNPEYNRSEMFSTAQFCFSINKDDALEIRNYETESRFLLCLIPLDGK